MNTFKKANCIKCKGSDPYRYCGKSFCPIYARAASMFKVKDKIGKEEFVSSSPAPFVGRYGYPEVNVGVLSPPEQKDDAWLFDAPRHWAKSSFDIPQIVDLRSALINSRFKANIKSSNRLLDISQEVGMASKPVDIDVSLKKKPVFRMSFEPYTAPMGPNAALKSMDITSNPKIDQKVDKVYSDTDLKANEAMLYLYDKGFDESFLSKILSVGTIGLKPNRKFVPTRWSITASDDSIGKKLIEQVKQYKDYECVAYFGGYLGNYFMILFFTDVWGYELFETYLPKASWNTGDSISYTTDYESYDGRKKYAEECAGGYYAARLPILEKMCEQKRQASVLCLRFISSEYAVPLGVWVVREAVRKALASKPIEFSSKELMLGYAQLKIKKKFGYDLENLLKVSHLMKRQKQKRLSTFLS
ncbi:MAG: hypothetical protein GY861_12260 [bacterium]|nr:hypothetical protein [bacterium]